MIVIQKVIHGDGDGEWILVIDDSRHVVTTEGTRYVTRMIVTYAMTIKQQL